LYTRERQPSILRHCCRSIRAAHPLR
jgi:hypothetical protein